LAVYRAFLGKMRVNITACLANAAHLPIRCTKEELAELREKLDESLSMSVKLVFEWLISIN
jgi:hypothetical protein